MVYEKLLKIFKEVMYDTDVDFTQIKKTDLLLEDLALNSISMLLIAIAVEDQFGVEITTKSLLKLKTVEDVVKFIEEEKRDWMAWKKSSKRWPNQS